MTHETSWQAPDQAHGTRRVRVEHPGETGWSINPPDGTDHGCEAEPFFVGRVGGSHTTWTYHLTDRMETK